jgi:uncharacterized membrane protein
MQRSAPETTAIEHRLPGSSGDPSRVPFARSLPWLLLLGGMVGLVAAFDLTVEKIALILDPTYVPSCSINPVLSCGSVMATPQASAFGFPNSLLGIAGFAVVTTSGAALLAGAQLHRWYWLGLLAGASAGVVFVHWLIVQSLYRIGALCPYCMVVWAVTIPIFWYVALHTLSRSDVLAARWRPVLEALTRYHTAVLTLWVVIILALITNRFWDYWSQLLTS